ncbi:PAS domain-containing sensor histidine kinase [Sneathiella sp.]|uniref:sensor histidine kinase n=1 Tax=Sneathiella sp. TaxID=1964365 RepID=UPI003567A828
MNTQGYKRVGFVVLSIILLISFAGGLYSINLARQFGDTQRQLAMFDKRLVEKTRLNNVLETAFGYGGFIHNFKNYVLRQDIEYKQNVESSYVKIIDALNAYHKFPIGSSEKQALDDIRATVNAYWKNLPRTEALIAAGTPIREIDARVRVDDARAIDGLNFLSAVRDSSFSKRLEIVTDMVEVENREILIIQLTIAAFMFVVILMFWWIFKYEKAWLLAQRRLRASETKFREIINNSADAIITSDGNGRAEIFNRAAVKIFGYEASEMIGQHVALLMPEEERPQHEAFFRASSPPGNPEDKFPQGFRGRRKDGSLFPIEMTVAPYYVNSEMAYVGILRDITEKKKAEEMLVNTMRSAIDAHKTKNLFIANMNHELRTPLNAIIGYTDIMVLEIFGALQPPKYREYVDDINGAGRHLLAIISDLLDLGAIEEGKLELERQVFRLAEIVNDSLKIIMKQAELAGVTLKYNPEDFDVSLFADARRLKQVLLNVLNNSIKFTERDGMISMHCTKEDDAVVISIEDTGIGVAEEDISIIFEPFQQARETHMTAKEGTGLGLPLSRNLVELHGGTMEFKSELGKGSFVTIRLPNDHSAAA